MERHGIEAVLSFDRGFDAVPSLRRIGDRPWERTARSDAPSLFAIRGPDLSIGMFETGWIRRTPGVG